MLMGEESTLLIELIQRKTRADMLISEGIPQREAISDNDHRKKAGDTLMPPAATAARWLTPPIRERSTPRALPSPPLEPAPRG